MSDNQNKSGDVLVPGHDYDGIQEFNNPAPFWWQLFFYISIAFGVCYFVYYQMMGGPTLKEELEVKMAAIKAKQPNVTQGPDEAMLAAIMNEPNEMAEGHKVFLEKCAVCHRADGGGLVGPNLTDNYWIHGKGKLTDIYAVVRDGALDKGMPNWGQMLSHEDLNDVVVYVKTLKGKTVENPKPPQGDLVTE